MATTLSMGAVLAQSSAHVQPKATPNPIGGPLNISVSEEGRFAKGHSWKLVVSEQGKATLTIETAPKTTKREFEISKSQRGDLRKALTKERFFELKHEYGELVSDGSETTITIAAGNRKNTVVLQFLMNWAHYDVAKLEEPARAIRVLHVIRGWFNDSEAVDLRKYDRMVLDAVAQTK
jgi:hypothetical protein